RRPRRPVRRPLRSPVERRLPRRGRSARRDGQARCRGDGGRLRPPQPVVNGKRWGSGAARRAIAVAAGALMVASVAVAIHRHRESRAQTGFLTLTRVPAASFSAGPTASAIGGLSAPGDGYDKWTAAGSLTNQDTGQRSAIVWSSPDGRRWRRTQLDAA